MTSNKKTIEQVARALKVDVREVSKVARQVLKLPSGNARDRKYLLSPYEAEQIVKVLGAPASEASVPPSENDLVSDEESGSSSPLLLRPDPTSDFGGFTFPDMNHGLRFHPDVTDALEGQEQLRKRLGIVLQHLAAHGRTTVVKGCSDEVNRGWLRSPLGGNNGMQYYLWWTHQGNRPVKSLDLSAREIVVRAVRHHDDHSRLAAGNLDSYFPFTQDQIEDEELVGRPWTDGQLRFVEADDPVRVILGRPGSGKTTVLWKAIEARSNQSVLYLTWSRELTRDAGEHLRTFAAADVRVETRDFASFLGEICRYDIERKTLDESLAAFNAAARRIGRDVLGPWAGREEALYAEIRAHLLGSAIPGEDGTQAVGDLVRLSDDAYFSGRGHGDGVGKKAANALLKVFGLIEKSTSFVEIFPELVGAARAIERLRRDEIPRGFSSFDRVVVDEVQDLTVLESAVIVELCRAIARVQGPAPWLLMAGDDGQTVRPSGFEWGSLNDLLAHRVGTPRKFQLEDNLRCPVRIASVIDRASARYAHLEKGRRPRKQRKLKGGQHVDANLFHVDVPSVSEAIELLEQLEDMTGVTVIVPQNRIPRWVPKHLRSMVLTPAEAKGLEYQSVCILDPGRLLTRLESTSGDSNATELEEHALRTTIDQLRVALSRATETLAFIDVEASDSERSLSWELLEDAAPFDPDDLAEHFTEADVPPEERVLARTSDARSLIDERPRRAWRRAHQAVRILGDPLLPNGVSDESVRSEAHTTLLATAARLLIDGVPEGVRRSDVIDGAGETLNAMLSPEHEQAFAQLDIWSADRTVSPFALFDATLSLGQEDEWLRPALVPVAQELRRAVNEGAHDASLASSFSGQVEGWLKLTGFAGDATEEAAELRRTAFDSLLEARDLSSAESVLGRLEPEDMHRTGRLREAQQRYEEAAEVFERAGAYKDAVRNWRGAGRWERAIKFAEKSERADLEWLADVTNTIERRPDGHADRLTPGEQERLTRLLDAGK
jgi:hypothetical protein